jgi:hypothetical protein
MGYGRVHNLGLVSLKRHSILVSESGEAQRIAFLQKQLEVINTL